MAGKSNKLKIKKLQINFTNRWLYTLIVFFSLIVIGVFVYAYGTNDPATFGHSAGELEAPSGCGTDQFLKWTGSSWTCAGVEAGTETDPVWTAASTNVAFINKANTFDGAITATTLTAATINTGNGAKEVNSIAAYLGNQNLRTTDSPTFGGATINGIFSLGTPTTKTISSGGAITVTRSYHKLDTYGGYEEDTLTKINGGENGMILVLGTSSALRDVTLRERTTANQGNIYLSGTSFTLDSGADKIVLMKAGTYWIELSRSNNIG